MQIARKLAISFSIESENSPHALSMGISGIREGIGFDSYCAAPSNNPNLSPTRSASFDIVPNNDLCYEPVLHALIRA
jgi:hypothetical protein